MGESYLANLQQSLIEHKSQFYDLIEIFRIGGYAPNTNYLFLGSFFSEFTCALTDQITRRLCRSRTIQRGDDIPSNLSEVTVS